MKLPTQAQHLRPYEPEPEGSDAQEQPEVIYHAGRSTQPARLIPTTRYRVVHVAGKWRLESRQGDIWESEAVFVQDPPLLPSTEWHVTFSGGSWDLSPGDPDWQMSGTCDP